MDIIEGVGFGAFDEEGSHLVFIEEDGSQRFQTIDELVPKNGREHLVKIKALMGGFGSEASARELEGWTKDLPTAYRIKITVEYEPLSRQETQALLDKAKAHNEELDQEI